MKLIIMKNVAIPALLLLLVSCNGTTSCHNLNPVFNKYKPGDFEYKNELGQQLLKKGVDNFTYTLAGYSNDTLRVNVQDDSICAIAPLQIVKYDEVSEKIRKVDGKGYHGAELNGLKIVIVRNESGISFLYRSADGITD
ncbi:MAG: hypothetical protein ACLGH8_17935 [Bacteroidia bacterium]